MMIHDDEAVEPPENITVDLTATGPSQEFIDLFNIIRPVTVVQIVDDDGEYYQYLSIYNYSYFNTV